MNGYNLTSVSFPNAGRDRDLLREAEADRQRTTARAAAGRPVSPTLHLLGAAIVRAGQLVQGIDHP